MSIATIDEIEAKSRAMNAYNVAMDMIKKEGSTKNSSNQHNNQQEDVADDDTSDNEEDNFDEDALDDKEQPDLKSRSRNTPQKAGRNFNKLFPFHPKCPKYGTHGQRISSVMKVPIVYGKIHHLPIRLKDNVKAQLSKEKVALQMLTLFKPWNMDTLVPSTKPTWNAFMNFIRQLADVTTAEWCSRAKLNIIQNMLNGIAISNKKKKLFQRWRFRETIPWTDMKTFNEAESKERNLFREALQKIVGNEKDRGDLSFDYDIPDESVYSKALQTGTSVANARDGIQEPDENADEMDISKHNLLELQEELILRNLAGDLGDDKPENTNSSKAIEYNNNACLQVSKIINANVFAELNQKIKDFKNVSTMDEKNPLTQLSNNTASHADDLIFDMNQLKLNVTTESANMNEDEGFKSDIIDRVSYLDDFIDRMNNEIKDVSIGQTIELLNSSSNFKSLLLKNANININDDYEMDMESNPQNIVTNEQCTSTTSINSLGDLIERENENPYGPDNEYKSPADGSFALNNQQDEVCTTIYQNVRGHFNWFIDKVVQGGREIKPEPLYQIIQGGPGAGKTTLFKELIRRLTTYLQRRKDRFMLMEYKFRMDASGDKRISDEVAILKLKMIQFKKINLGLLQCATTHAGAAVVKNNCQTVTSFFKLPVMKGGETTMHQDIVIKTSNAPKKPLNLNQILIKRNELEESGCYLITIDEVLIVLYIYIYIYIYTVVNTYCLINNTHIHIYMSINVFI
jgi:hypothetical protein